LRIERTRRTATVSETPVVIGGIYRCPVYKRYLMLVCIVNNYRFIDLETGQCGDFIPAHRLNNIVRLHTYCPDARMVVPE
jgi:hypothetical protein